MHAERPVVGFHSRESGHLHRQHWGPPLGPQCFRTANRCWRRSLPPDHARWSAVTAVRGAILSRGSPARPRFPAAGVSRTGRERSAFGSGILMPLISISGPSQRTRASYSPEESQRHAPWRVAGGSMLAPTRTRPATRSRRPITPPRPVTLVRTEDLRQALGSRCANAYEPPRPAGRQTACHLTGPFGFADCLPSDNHAERKKLPTRKPDSLSEGEVTPVHSRRNSV